MDVAFDVRVLKKVTYRLIPLLMLMFTVSFIDRVNVGFAALTMNRDLGLSPAMFGFGAGIFFIGYLLFQIPSNLILSWVGARVWLPCIMIVWGVISGAMAGVHSATGFYILRFLLGVAEAGFYPGAIFYISRWFPAHKKAEMTALLVMGSSIAIAIGSPISGALLEMDGLLGLKGWQWMFLVEAIPAIVLGLIAFFCLTDSPEEATWLSEDERNWLVQTMDAEEKKKKDLSNRGVWSGILDIRILVLSVIYFGMAAALFVSGVWAPTMIKELGFNPLQVGFLNAVPAIFSLAAMVLFARHSDRTGERTWHVIIGSLVGAVGLLIAGLFAPTLISVMIALILINFGATAPKPPLWTMPPMFLSGSALAAAIAAINSVGNLGGFFGPSIVGYAKGVTGSFSGGLYAVAVCLVVSAGLMLVISKLRPMQLDEPATRKSNPLMESPVEM